MIDRVSGRFGGHLVSLLVGVSFSLSALPAAEPIAAPAAADVTAANWYWGPANRWSWHNTRRIFPTAQVSRGSGPVTTLARTDRDLAKVTFTDPVTHKSMTVAEMLDSTYTDGFLVLQHGRILSEIYRNGLTQEQPHLFMSISKSVMGTLAGILPACAPISLDSIGRAERMEKNSCISISRRFSSAG
jgi:CubicO group peptidase (beta-lactamase class C family)